MPNKLVYVSDSENIGIAGHLDMCLRISIQVINPLIELAELRTAQFAAVDEEEDVHNLDDGVAHNGLPHHLHTPVDRLAATVGLAQIDLQTQQCVEVPVTVVVFAPLRVEVVGHHIGIHLGIQRQIVVEIDVCAQATSDDRVPAGVPYFLKLVVFGYPCKLLLCSLGIIIAKRKW